MLNQKLQKLFKFSNVIFSVKLWSKQGTYWTTFWERYRRM